MLNRDMLMDAMAGVRDEDVLRAGQALGYLPRRARRNYWRPLLIAATLAALLTATAVAAGLLGRAEHLAPMPPDPSGELRQAEIPNGFRGTPTYQGSAEWWSYMASWEDIHGQFPRDLGREFVKDDLDKYLVCGLYKAYEPEQAETLYGIAEKYGLRLFTEQIHFFGLREFYGLTGAEPFVNIQDLRCQWGHVLEDGSFVGAFSGRRGRENYGFDVCRYYSGSIYPFGGAAPAQAYEEEEYITARGDRVYIDIFSRYEGEITYNDPTGETYITIRPCGYDREIGEAARELADRIDFQALCRKDLTEVQKILSQPTGAEDNPQAVETLMAFQNSPVFQGGLEFQRFYQENFYGACFTGTYGLEGYEDIDRELERVAQKYGLRYAKEKTVGNATDGKAVCFDNGAWQSRRGFRVDNIHVIPRDALYTMLWEPFPDLRAYRRIWDCRAEDGTDLVLFTQGPEEDSGSFALCQTEKVYILAEMYTRIPEDMEQIVKEIPWRELSETGGIQR